MPTDKSTEQKNHINVDYTASASDHGMRLDMLLAALYPEASRSRWQDSIKRGEVRCNGEKVKAKYSIVAGDIVNGNIALQNDEVHKPQAIELDIRYRDDDIIIINKPAGLVVHPAAGNRDGTLLNALLHHFPSTAELPRAGIVHRLDKDTSGLMVVAHSVRAHTSLVNQLQTRSMGRTYLALVHRYVTAGGDIDEPIGRHHRERVKMAVRSDGKAAITHYRIEERFEDLTLLRVNLETGRTHQIRVHMAHLHHPLVGDTVYAGKPQLPKNIDEAQRQAIANFPRQALHACELRLTHPGTNEAMSFEAELPADMAELLNVLRTHSPA